MKAKIILILIVLVSGCGTTSKLKTVSLVSENNKDVFILSTLIRDYLRNTNGRDLNLNELVKSDPLNRISNNFETIELKSHGGYIAVNYKFSVTRDINRIELIEIEKEEINKLKWIVKDLKEQYDGEIRFDFGERFYRIRKIVTSLKRNVVLEF